MVFNLLGSVMFFGIGLVSVAGEIDPAMGGKHIDAFDDACIAYMRGCARDKAADLVGPLVAERAFELRREPAAEP